MIPRGCWRVPKLKICANDNCRREFLACKKRHKFCSKSCWNKSYRKKCSRKWQNEKRCTECGSTFVPVVVQQKWCTIRCQEKARRHRCQEQRRKQGVQYRNKKRADINRRNRERYAFLYRDPQYRKKKNDAMRRHRQENPEREQQSRRNYYVRKTQRMFAADEILVDLAISGGGIK